MRLVAGVFALAASCLACEPGPVPVPPPGARPSPANPTGAPRPEPAATTSFAPDEAGISDIARVSRYVFREMNAHPACGLEALPPGRYDYVYEVTVTQGRIAQVRLSGVSHADAAGSHAVAQERWPKALEQRLACLLPHLQRVEMAPAAADGVYPTRFAAGGSAP